MASAVWLLLAGLLTASGAPALWAQSSRAARLWQNDIQEIDELLLAGQWKRAETYADRLAAEMERSITGGGAEYLGSVAALQAVARAAKGDLASAVWRLETARALFPGLVTQLDLGRYGEPGAALGAALSPERCATEEPLRVATGRAPVLQQPRAIETPSPLLPPARSRSDAAQLKARIVVAVDGTPRCPELLGTSGDFAVVAAYLEAIGRWCFEPARLDGTPVAVPLTLDLDVSTQ